MKRVLITGAAGFLGGYVADACRQAGYSVIGADIHAPYPGSQWEEFRAEACETVDWESLLGGREVTAVVHLAGGASVPDSVREPYRDFMLSLPGTAKLLSYCAQRLPSAHFILFSSAAVYGNPQRLPIGESTAVAPVSPYGVHKACAEFLVESYARLYGLQASILRVFSAYGPGLKKQLFWDLARRALEASARGESTVRMHGSGNETRDFIYSADIAAAALRIADLPRQPGCRRFNIASGQATSIREAAALLVDRLGLDLELAFDGAPRDGDPLYWQADVTKAAEIGFRATMSLSDGLAEVARWSVSDAIERAA
ncbi:MAG TPA: NAD-dependent epimerase/dehydratase family protein [Bryobacteraceae bacterium]|nr:NAD-dependent epimerase/dehydratase family protein [Bryobacteraceae bacterium]